MSTRVIICALGVLAVSASTGTAVAASPAGTPDPSAIVLRAADFPAGVKQLRAGKAPVRAHVVAGYETQLEFTTTFGKSRYAIAVSTAFVETSAATAAADYAKSARLLSSKSWQLTLAKAMKLTGSVKLTFARPRALGVPDSSMELAGFTTGKTHLSISYELLRLDRVLVIDLLLGDRSPVIADAQTLTGIVAAKAKAQLVPTALAAPTVSGTAQQGQTLTAAPGTWSNAPTAYTYQWQSCDATGASCTDVAGATASTYAVQASDAGRTLRVEVTARNGQGTTQVPSAVTAVVS